MNTSHYDEPAWMKEARKAPLRSTYESRQQPQAPTREMPARTDSIIAMK